MNPVLVELARQGLHLLQDGPWTSVLVVTPQPGEGSVEYAYA